MFRSAITDESRGNRSSSCPARQITRPVTGRCQMLIQTRCSWMRYRHSLKESAAGCEAPWIVASQMLVITADHLHLGNLPRIARKVPVTQREHEAHDRVLRGIRRAKPTDSARVHGGGRFRHRPAGRALARIVGMATRQVDDDRESSRLVTKASNVDVPIAPPRLRSMLKGPDALQASAGEMPTVAIAASAESSRSPGQAPA